MKLTKRQHRHLARIIAALAVFIVIEVLPTDALFGPSRAIYAEFVLFLVPYLIAGYDVLYKAARGIAHGQVFDENFLMSIATIGAFLLVLFPESGPHMAEGAAVMLFYQVGEFFEGYAVGKARSSIAQMMDIAPDVAHALRDGGVIEVDPYEIEVGECFVVSPGERVPLDGIVVEGSTLLDMAALTGESAPASVAMGNAVVSGSVALDGVIIVEATKPYDQSTVQRILELVENASERKATTERFITRFARWYTPAVVFAALAVALLPPLVAGQLWSAWIQRALVFLVVSCPCALVISVPLSFFGAIGAASRKGVLVKGSNVFEALAKIKVVVFDKTGTLTNGTFAIAAIHPASGIDPQQLVDLAAHAEAFSTHPAALCVRQSLGKELDLTRVCDVQELGGRGVVACVDGARVCIGNGRLMEEERVELEGCDVAGTILHVSRDGGYLGHIVLADTPKPGARDALAALRDCGVESTVMLTGDKEEVARAVACELGISEVRSQLLPQDKVACIEELIASRADGAAVAFVGDGINDAPVLMRADVGIAMGAMGSDAAVEASDVVLMDDDPAKIALAMRIARKAMRIVWQNIIFALGVKVLIMVLALFGIANLWVAVFGDVGVAILAILNAMRTLRV